MFTSYFYPPKPSRIWPQSNLFSTLNKNTSWDAELKYNGWRCLIYKENEKIYIWNRHKSIIDIEPKLFLSHFVDIPNNTIFDGELINFRTKNLKNIIIIFDCPFYNGIDLRKTKLKTRREYLESFKMAPKTLQQSKHSKVYRIQQFSTAFKRLYTFTQGSDILEGIVIKQINSFYQAHPSRSIETNDWLKVKKIENHAKI